MDKFKEGQIVAFVGKDFSGEIYKVEIGKIKKLCKDGAFVYYHSGETAAKTEYRDLYPINNDFYINDTSLGVGGLV